MKEMYIENFDKITDEDWNYYLSFTPKEYIDKVKSDLISKNRFFVEQRFKKLLYWYAFDEMSRYEATRYIYPNTIFQRARIFDKDCEGRNPNPPFHGFDKANSFVPDESIKDIPEGRGNPDLIRYLYAASDIDTAIAEVTPCLDDTISVAKIRVNEPLILLNFAKYSCSINAADNERTAWIQKFFLGVASIFQKPSHREKYEYLLCQYICEFIKVMGLDGVIFYSSRVQRKDDGFKGINYTIFNYNKCEAISSELYVVSNIEISHTSCSRF